MVAMVTTDGLDEFPTGGKELQSIVIAIGDDNIVIRIGSDPKRVIELALGMAVAAEFGDETAILGKDLNPVIICVSDNDMTSRIGTNCVWIIELPVIFPIRS